MGFFKPAWQSKNVVKALQAVRKITDRSTLEKIIKHSVHYDVRITAKEKLREICEHNWNGCKCTLCGKTRDEQHKWGQCKNYLFGKCLDDRKTDSCYLKTQKSPCICSVCTDCGKIKPEHHSGDSCRCFRCGEKLHECDWNGCKCARCGSVRDEQHEWNGYKCTRCGRDKPCEHNYVSVRDGYNEYDGQYTEYKCTICGNSYRDSVPF